MTIEERELLLKDLCARLHYGVKVAIANPAVKIGVISGISIGNKISVRTKHADIVFDCEEVKPYLRPMTSMTQEEKEEFTGYSNTIEGQLVGMEGRIIWGMDWLNAHHFDYRGLIEKGLAIEAPKEYGLTLQLPRLSGHNKNSVSYIRKDAFIEKTINFLNYKLDDVVATRVPGTIIPYRVAKSELIEDLKNFMESNV